MADFIRIEVTGLTELQLQLERAAAQLEHPGDLMDVLGAILEAQIGGRFDSKTDPDGLPWDQLADSTQARYDAEDTNGRGKLRRRGTLLERTRQMRDSLAREATDDSVLVGMTRLTDNQSWAIPLLHETGTERMPRRGIFLGDWEAGRLGAEDERLLLDEIGSWLDDVLG